MTPLTEADLLRMREVQAKATPGPLRLHKGETLNDVFIRDEDNQLFILRARLDWPRLTEWALEARRLLAIILDTPTVKRLDFEDGSPWIRTQVNEAWIEEARRLLGEP